MGECDKTDGRTAMERLCRELAECVLSCDDSAAKWAEAHGIDCDDVLYTVIRGDAKADIERRIGEAKVLDGDGRLALGVALELLGRIEAEVGGDSGSLLESVAGKAGKAAELDALREAGRIMPEGVSWPRYEDGEPVRIGDELDDGEVAAATLTGTRYELSDRDDCCLDTGQHGARVERPAPKAIGADGREVKPGDTVWLAPEHRKAAGKLPIQSDFECGLFGVGALDQLTVDWVGTKGQRDGTANFKDCGAWCPASWLTHERPVLDRYGVPIEAGDTVWDEEGREWTVVSAGAAECLVQRAEKRSVAPRRLSHERPDSWERLREDADKGVDEYWGCGDARCSDCPVRVGGKTPRERYSTDWCDTATQLDLVARAERLAGVRGDA